MSGDKKLIYFLITLNIFLAIILLIKIKTKPQYNPKVYNEIYDEYEDIFGKENDANLSVDNFAQNEVENNVLLMENNIYATTSDKRNGNIVGKIIIPKINIKYPIIKETTTEYLKVAPTKLCGPEVNEIREFSYSRS